MTLQWKSLYHFYLSPYLLVNIHLLMQPVEKEQMFTYMLMMNVIKIYYCLITVQWSSIILYPYLIIIVSYTLCNYNLYISSSMCSFFQTWLQVIIVEICLMTMESINLTNRVILLTCERSIKMIDIQSCGLVIPHHKSAYICFDLQAVKFQHIGIMLICKA